MNEPIPVIQQVDQGTARLLPDVDRARAWLLTVEGAPQSYVDLDDPAHLEFEYVRRLAHVLDCAEPGPLDLVHLGGGALTLPRYAALTRPGSRQTVVESDRALAALVAERLPLPAEAAADVEVRVGDAREELAALPAGSVDVVLADVFTGSRVPGHLTTVSYARTAARALRPGGLYAANLADGTPFAFLRSQLATFAEVFAHLCLVAEPSVLRGRRFGNTVLVASDEPLPVAGLTRRCAGDAFAARVTHSAELRRFTGRARPVTDERGADSPEPPRGAFRLA